MGHRYYNCANCRWLTRDPIGYDGGINLYAYCGNNPVNLADPWGFCGNQAGDDDWKYMQDVQGFRDHIPQLMAQQVLNGAKQMVGFALPGVLGPLGDAAEALTSMGGGAAASTAVADATTTLDKLGSLATEAAEDVGPGSGHAYGSNVHTAFKQAVNALDNPNLLTERSFLNGSEVNYGTPGSIRVDALEGSVTNPTAIYDLKTGSATLTDTRIREILSHLPNGGAGVIVYVVRP